MVLMRLLTKGWRDENSQFFHGVLNKKRSQLNIRGIMVDGVWTEKLNTVKQEFLQHFRRRFDKPTVSRTYVNMSYPKSIRIDQLMDLERDVSKEESNFFFTYGDIPKGCNSSFIALILKVLDANLVKDFRPISLIGSIYKIIAKILANCLVGVLGDIVNEVQSAFIAERQILDGPFILNEVLKWCKLKKKQSLIFKVDFEKAYDSVRLDFLDDVLKKFGFGNKWCAWIQSFLRSSRGSIIINGSPTEEFQFFKGHKQGDSLSPFLFILIMESLHSSFQRVVDAGMFMGIKLSHSLNLSHMFYANDAVFVGQWCDGNINTPVHVLECFYRASGLRINMSKSTKVGGSMLRVQAWKEVVDKVKSRLPNWKMKALSIGGRLTLLKSVLGSMPIFHMSIFRVPLSVLRMLESIRSHFFNGHELRSNKATWVKWNCRWRLRRKGKTSLWARVIKAICGDDGKVGKITDAGIRSCWMNIVNEISVLKNQGVNVFDFMRLKLGNRDTTVFWEDNWIGGNVLKDLYPRIYALETCKSVTVSKKLTDSSLDNAFRRKTRGGVEQVQYNALSDPVHAVTLVPSSDRWVWSLEILGEFSVASVQKVIDEKRLSNVNTMTRWIKCVLIKVNVLAWKIKIDALPTRLNISRRGKISRKISLWWDVTYVDVNSYVEWVTWMMSLRLASNLKLMLEGVFFVMWWYLWSYRNKLLFETKAPLKAVIFDDVVSSSYYWCRYRCKASFSWDDWLKNPNLVSL
nr:RNA-directed DNA polymerase, eukaryota, reverse transcriptase zinc-binding domain protein [Tanacetum cinerariifolium]